MQTGFWDDFEQLKIDSDFVDWEYLRGQKDNVVGQWRFSPYDYLNGFCDAFAQALNERFGYDLEYIIERQYLAQNAPTRLIHAYCIKDVGDQVVYVDVRGQQTDFDQFLVPFGLEEKDFDGKYYFTVSSVEPLDRYRFAKRSKYLIGARQLIKENQEFYW